MPTSAAQKQDKQPGCPDSWSLLQRGWRVFYGHGERGMRQLLIATNNRDKLHELLPLLGALPFHLVTPHDLGLHLEVEETGTTYAENARLKAEAFVQASGLLTLADDSGLEVEALDGAPGVQSARYAGAGASDADRRARLIRALYEIPAPRLARFCCVIALAPPGSALTYFEGVCAGEIILAERGTSGFGYDPLFFLPDRGATMAELPSDVKNQISHRARAVQAAWPLLQQLATRP
jgi:XTP/dITP diphosphohydrolase